MSTKLTIGMATYDDFHGVYFSIQSVRMHHSEVINDIEFIVVDNNPDGEHGKEVKKFLSSVPNCKYIAFSEFQSTAVRNIIFTTVRMIITTPAHSIRIIITAKIAKTHIAKTGA